MSTWPEHAIWWHVYPLGATGAEREAPGRGVAHRFGHLQAWLDYVIELGCSGLALGPIFTSQTHGYDTVDHFQIDPRLGDDADFDALVAQARARGLRVLLDGVFNHVGRGHPRFQDALREGPGSEAARWFRMRWPSGGGEPSYDCFEGHASLVTINHDEPAVVEHVARVMKHWCARGADGWRLDAAYAVPPAFWRAVLPQVRQAHPDAWFVGEVLHGDYAGYVADSGLDSVTQYELWKALWSAVNDRNLFELAWALERHDRFAAQFLPLTFVGNHDVTRLASKLDDLRNLGHVLAVWLAVAGTPSIYYGDEQAFRGVKEQRAGGDDAVRPPLPETPQQLAAWGWPVYRQHQALIALRRRHAWLARSRCEVVHLTNEQTALRLTSRDGPAREQIFVLLNLADAAARIAVPGLDASAALEAASDMRPTVTDAVVLPPHAWGIFSKTP